MKMQRRYGISEITFHVNDGPLVWNEPAHREIGHTCVDIGAGPKNRAVILAGTGDS